MKANDADQRRHSDLINLDPEFVPAEARHLAGLMESGRDFFVVDSVFDDVVRLFAGGFPGYRACNTPYHDLEHTTDTFLAMARLLHGSFAAGKPLGPRSVTLGLVSALLHDVGYIQLLDDTAGTGAKYTSTHITRSIEFMERYFQDRGLSPDDASFCRNCLLCTGLGTRMSEIRFASEEESTAGRMLGSADLLGQMADRKYLEKLLFLYQEFREGGVPGYENEADLLRKTLDFHRLTTARLDGELGGVHRHMRAHFARRWNFNADPYRDSIERNLAHIRFIVGQADGDYRAYLRRGGVVNRLRGNGG